MGIIQTDLGWEADENFVVYNAGTYLGTLETNIYEREFFKTEQGYGIVAFIRRPTYSGPMLISTVSDYAKYTQDRVLLPNGTVKHFTKTWYINTQYHLIDPKIYTDYPIYTFSTDSAIECARAILDFAGVKLIRSDKVWSFLAGLSCGVSGQALPKMEGI